MTTAMDRQTTGLTLLIVASALGLGIATVWSAFLFIPGYVPGREGLRWFDHVGLGGILLSVAMILFSLWLMFGGALTESK